MFRAYVRGMEAGESLPQPERETDPARAVFAERYPGTDWERFDYMELLAAAREIQFAVEEVLIPKILDTFRGKEEPEPYVGSAFDAYDEEQGYADEPQASIWRQWAENANALLSTAIRLLRESYTGALNAPLLPLLEFLQYEMEHQK